MTRSRPEGLRSDRSRRDVRGDSPNYTDSATPNKTPHDAWRYKLPGHQGIRILVRPVPATAAEIAAELRARFGAEPVLLEPISGGHREY